MDNYRDEFYLRERIFYKKEIISELKRDSKYLSGKRLKRFKWVLKYILGSALFGTLTNAWGFLIGFLIGSAICYTLDYGIELSKNKILINEKQDELEYLEQMLKNVERDKAKINNKFYNVEYSESQNKTNNFNNFDGYQDYKNPVVDDFNDLDFEDFESYRENMKPLKHMKTESDNQETEENVKRYYYKPRRSRC